MFVFAAKLSVVLTNKRGDVHICNPYLEDLESVLLN